MRDARTALLNDAGHDPDAAAALATIKAMYAQGIGMLASSNRVGRDGYAPERRHIIVARSRCNILRLVNQIGEKTGQWPIAAGTDAIAYVSDDPDPWSAWPGPPEKLGYKLGQFKPEESAELTDDLAAQFTGDRWRKTGFTPAPPRGEVKHG